MTNKERYQGGKDAIKGMEYIIGEVLWTNEVLPTILGLSLQEINNMYQNARDAAVTFGEDISQYPRRLRWRTNGLQIIGA